MIAKFRCSSHGLAIETGIHCQNVIPKKERICLYCTKFQNNYVTECDFHFLMQCPAYNDLRNKYLSTFFTEISSKLYISTYMILKSRNETCIKAVGLFLQYAFIVRRNIIALVYYIFTCTTITKPL